MDGATQVANMLLYQTAQKLAAAVRFANRREAEVYNQLAIALSEANQLIDVPGVHATPSFNAHSACYGRGCSPCFYAGTVQDPIPHTADACATCKLAHLASGYGIRLNNMPAHGPWESNYVQPPLAPGITREGTFRNGTLVRERLQIARSDGSEIYLYISCVAIDMMTTFFQRATVTARGVRWGSVDYTEIAPSEAFLGAWEVVETWPTMLLENRPLLYTNLLTSISPTLNNLS